MEDLSVLGYKPSDKGKEVMLARGVSIFWGITILIMSLFAGSIAPTVIEAINKVGSALYGPILGVFLIGMLSRRVGGLGASVGLLAGLIFNLYLWKAQPQIFWMWWNFIGLVVTSLVALVIGTFTGRISDDIPHADHGSTVASVLKSPYTMMLLAVFVLIVVISAFLRDAQSWFVQ